MEFGVPLGPLLTKMFYTMKRSVSKKEHSDKAQAPSLEVGKASTMTRPTNLITLRWQHISVWFLSNKTNMNRTINCLLQIAISKESKTFLWSMPPLRHSCNFLLASLQSPSKIIGDQDRGQLPKCMMLFKWVFWWVNTLK